MFKKLLTAVYCLMGLSCYSVWAADMDAAEVDTDDWQITLGVAPLIVPEYEGADEYRFIPVPLIDIKYQDTYFFSPYRGLGANLVNTSNLQIGPAMTYRLWQDEDDNPALKGIGDIPGTLEVGGFIYYTFKPIRFAADIKQGVNGHRGAIANGSVEWVGKINEKTRFTIGPRVAWVSHNYMQTYFGIDNTQASRSKFDPYFPDAGFKDIGIGGSVFYAFNQHWNMGIFGQYARLVGDAADSPIVKEEGSPNQMTLAFSVGYMF